MRTFKGADVPERKWNSASPSAWARVCFLPVRLRPGAPKVWRSADNLQGREAAVLGGLGGHPDGQGGSRDAFLPPQQCLKPGRCSLYTSDPPTCRKAFVVEAEQRARLSHRYLPVGPKLVGALLKNFTPLRHIISSESSPAGMVP